MVILVLFTDFSVLRNWLERNPAMGNIRITFFVSGGINGFRQYLAHRYPSAFRMVPTTRIRTNVIGACGRSFPRTIITPLSNQLATQQSIHGTQFLPTVDHLCIDMNQIVHNIARGTNYQLNRQFCHRFHHIVEEHIQRFQPQKSVVFAFDGTAPFAKLMTQRSRRLESPELSPLTPGSEFMNSMENLTASFILRYISHNKYEKPDFKQYRAPRRPSQYDQLMKNNDNAVLLPNHKQSQFFKGGTTSYNMPSVPSELTFFVSCPDQGGEGEIKLIQWVKDHLILSRDSHYQRTFRDENGGWATNGRVRTTSPPSNFFDTEARHQSCESHRDTIVLCGMDSDLILEALPLTGDNDVFVFALNGREQHLCHVNQLLDCMGIYVNPGDHTQPLGKEIPDEYQKLNQNRIFDMIFLYGLMGNDYLPKLRGLSWEFLEKTYIKAMNSLPSDRAFIYSGKDKAFTYAGMHAFISTLLADQSVLVASSSASIPNLKDELHLLGSLSKMGIQFGNENTINFVPSLNVTGQRLEYLNINNETIFTWHNPPSQLNVGDIRTILTAIALDEVFSPNFTIDFLRASQESLHHIEKYISNDAIRLIKRSFDIIGNAHSKYQSKINVSVLNHSIVGIRDDIQKKISRLREIKRVATLKDAENYLQGFLWYIDMYRQGRCSDFSYSHHDFAPVSALHIREFLKSSINNTNGLIKLDERFCEQ